MTDRQGRRRCGQRRVAVQPVRGKVTQCLCSISFRKGALHRRAAALPFRVSHGEPVLPLCQSGPPVYSHPRTVPDMIGIHARHPDDFDLLMQQVTIGPLDDGLRTPSIHGHMF